jgi:hypothetical protein
MITVTSRKRLGEPWESKQGNTFFPFVVNLSDGTTVMANGSSEDPWWKEGTPVVFKDSGNRTAKGLPKGGFDKPMGVVPSATPASNHSRVAHGEREIGMRVGMSINNACNLLRGTTLKGAEFERELEARARAIYAVAERITANPTGETLHDAKAAIAAEADEEVPF